MPQVIDVPGVVAPVVIEQGVWMNRITVAGERVPKDGWRTWLLPTEDGLSVPATLKAVLMGAFFAVEVKGETYSSAPPIPGWLKALYFLPFVAIVLVAIALLAGDAVLATPVAIVGILVNGAIFRQRLPDWVTALLFVLVSVCAILLYLVASVIGWLAFG
jgi:hypothetical protein